MMELPSSSGEWRRWGEVSSGAALTSPASGYRRRLIYWGGHVYAIVSAFIYGFAFCCLTQCGLATHRCMGSAKMQRQTLLRSLSSCRCGGWVWALSSEHPMCFRLVESAWTQWLLFGPVNSC